MILHASGGSLNSQAAQRIGNIVLSHAHGVISKLLHGRTAVCDRAEAARKIADNAEGILSFHVAELTATRPSARRKQDGGG